MGHGASVERGLGYGAVPSSRPLRTGSSLCALPSPAGSAPTASLSLPSQGILLLSAPDQNLGVGVRRQGGHAPCGIWRRGMEAAVLPRVDSASEHLVGTCPPLIQGPAAFH